LTKQEEGERREGERERGRNLDVLALPVFDSAREATVGINRANQL
jgi:hypothetical protein